eukprot:scpid105023/ scgid16832/ 
MTCRPIVSPGSPEAFTVPHCLLMMLPFHSHWRTDPLPTQPIPGCPLKAFMPNGVGHGRLHVTRAAAPLNSPGVSSPLDSATPFSNITLTCDDGYHVTGQGKDTYVAVSTCNESG